MYFHIYYYYLSLLFPLIGYCCPGQGSFPLLVDPHMRPQGYSLNESFATDSTAMRSLAGVRHDVMLERVRFAEGAIADLAGKVFDAAVNDFDVSRKVALMIDRV